MAEQVISDLPEEVLAAINPGPVSIPGIEPGEEEEEESPLELVNSSSRANSYASSSSNTVSTVGGISFSKILYFTGTCSINLILPFVNGLMLGFGELIAHEISWKFNWFGKSNKGYKIYPESRKLAALKEQQIADQEAVEKKSDGFL
ncbi:LAFE_0G11782g1_1 [Lachancea fermentati]|uniref:LAFE_0G11782g1_1 n=1 Tax=Lachancea fermentati TaxID=4955 RepID=A0A1G4MHV4_LACFM|nr:LAFE_0G11782g1_1 [Lachancea fermentati]